MLAFSKHTKTAIPLRIVTPDGLETWAKDASKQEKAWIEAQAFKAEPGQMCSIPSNAGTVGEVLVGQAKPDGRKRFVLADVAARLPDGAYRIVSDHPQDELAEHALGWLLSQYSFGRYNSVKPHRAGLVRPEGLDTSRIEAIANGEALTRDLINTPASDMGPDKLEDAARELATAHGARLEVCTGNALIEHNFPMIHTVGRASATPPRLLDMAWGNSGPTLTLVGKGVCFDTGG